MPVGPGKYDDITTHVREETNAQAVAVIVVNGNKGSGFSIQLEDGLALNLPRLLRIMADEIENSASG